MYVDIGSMLNLSCVVSFTERPPIKVSWLHNGIEISFRGPRNGVSVSHILIEFLSRHTFPCHSFPLWFLLLGEEALEWKHLLLCSSPFFDTATKIADMVFDSDYCGRMQPSEPTTWVPFRLGYPKAVFRRSHRRDCLCYQACHYRKFASVRKVLPDRWWWCDRRDCIESWRLEN